MAVVLSHMSSIRFLSSSAVDLDGISSRPAKGPWTFDAPPLQPYAKQRFGAVAMSVPGTNAAGRICQSIGESGPLHILVNQADRLRRDGVVCHSSSVGGSQKPYLKINEGLYVCVPELVFLQMAPLMTDIELIDFGFELCGYYSIRNSPDKDIVCRRPLTTVSRLESFAREAVGVHGAKRARRLIRHVIEGSASPAETNVAMLLTLPYAMGGFCIPKPRINHRAMRYQASAGEVAGSLLRGQDAVCDFSWPGCLVEYDSEAEHSYGRMEKDALRRNDLSVDARILQVTKNQLAHPGQTRHLANLIAKHISYRMRPRVDGFEDKQCELRRELNRVHGNDWLKCGPF